MSAPARRRSRLAVPAALIATVALVAVIVAAVTLSGSGDDPASDRAATTAPRQETSTSTTPTRTQPRASASPASPTGAVRAFYERAADGKLASAWRLAGPRFRQAFGGSQERFRGTLGTLRSIEFRRLEETARSGGTATVAIETIARHTTRTDRCTGTLQAVRDGPRRWLVEPQGVSCRAT